ncbi:glutamate receptor ionotropic, kainate glr-3-like [Haliotis rufescens]|uniref:glutamate receptor ionotropic, kainate glr-3-like n=1 Tax=Haliotis rufescens TaxID=6454 RepID=UPI00201F701C|nr:glutamate receptor ionotropic, kainate glr-3-like [Haliotis rufescens]
MGYIYIPFSLNPEEDEASMNENDCLVPARIPSLTNSIQFLVYDLSIMDANNTLQEIHEVLFPEIHVVASMSHRHMTELMKMSPVYIVKSTNNGTTQYKGYAIDILDTIAAFLNFSYSVTEPLDQSWGLPVNGTYDGIVGQLNRTEVDLAACNLVINEGRSDFMDYIYPPIRTDYIVVVYKRHDKQRTTSLFLLALPLRPTVCLILLLVAGLCPLLLAVFESGDFGWNKTAAGSGDVGVTYVKKVKQNLLSACWEVTGSLFKQGFSKYPRTLPGKVLVTSWWMLMMVMTTVYCANLVAALSAETDVKPFSDLEGLLDSDYSVGMDVGGISSYLLKSSLPSSVNGRMWSKIAANDPVFLDSNAEVHFKRVRSEKYAFLHHESNMIRPMAEDCQLELLGESVLWSNLAFGLPQRSPLKADFDKA